MNITRRSVIASAVSATLLGLTLATAPPANALGQDISRADVIARAKNWSDRNVQYSQKATASGPSGVHTWRTDCSGFISMAWLIGPTGLSAPNTTALAGSTYDTSIAKASLNAGDILVLSGVHAVMFEKWANAAHTTFWLYEEANSSADMNHRVASLSTYSSYSARRYKNITG